MPTRTMCANNWVAIDKRARRQWRAEAHRHDQQVHHDIGREAVEHAPLDRLPKSAGTCRAARTYAGRHDRHQREVDGRPRMAPPAPISVACGKGPEPRSAACRRSRAPNRDRQDHREQDVERAGDGGRDGDRLEHGVAFHSLLPTPPAWGGDRPPKADGGGVLRLSRTAEAVLLQRCPDQRSTSVRALLAGLRTLHSSAKPCGRHRAAAGFPYRARSRRPRSPACGDAQ